ncbi:glycerophosphodiester phosphodiesterase [Nocardioides aequoreus]|uniref:glycerophosphodiester phosphodiesterase n=1 Tax=Nocardioides aequoreus TaxID=397278 RepID=UPI0004C4491B|nr:glycerophosphodiester phosphodiesterase family protein [Nocardioides aequoreus]
MARQTPLVVAHRGASSEHAEHTLAAYVAALDAGADGLECDVRLTADGHLVCVHDRDLRRTAASRGVVSAMELAELERIDMATWKNPWADLDDEAPDTDPERGRILTLRRLIETSLDYDRPVRMAIETKHPTRYAGLVERRLAELLDDFGFTAKGAPVQVMSFSWVALRRMQRLTPDLDLVMLVDDRRQHWARVKPFVEPHWILGPGIETVRSHPGLVRSWIRDKGRSVHCWVVNDPADADLCADLGIEAIITDEPARMRRHLGV